MVKAKLTCSYCFLQEGWELVTDIKTEKLCLKLFTMEDPPPSLYCNDSELQLIINQSTILGFFKYSPSYLVNFLIFLSATNKMMLISFTLKSTTTIIFLSKSPVAIPYLIPQMDCHKLMKKRTQMKSLILHLFQPIYPHCKFLLPRYGFTGMSSSSRCSSLCVWERWRFSDVTRISIAAVFISQDIWLSVEISCSGWG